MFCNNCGASLPEKSAFCANCGRPVQMGSSTGATQPAAAASGAAAGAQPAPAASTTAGTPPAAPVSTSPWLNVPPAQPMRQPSFAGQPQTDGKAVASLVLGIMGVAMFLSFIAGIPAVILGHLSRKSIRESMGRLKGDGMALAGLIMGYLSIASIPVILIIAAIAIPNLLRAKLEANNSSAASAVRIVNTSQATYSATYPAKGYARDLTTLGPGSSGECSAPSESCAGLIDSTLANVKLKNGFRYSMTATCGSDGVCTDYVTVATPVNASTGSRNYCSTADAVVRSNRVVPLASPPTTVEECQAWPPL
jgi:type IV pilus assembly protein PilA